MVAVGLIFAVLAAGALFLWYGWDRLSKRFKGAEKLNALLLRTGPAVEKLHLLIESDMYLVDHKTRKAWLLYPDAIQRDKNARVAGVVLTSNSCIPQFPGTAGQDIPGICAQLKERDPYLCHDRAMAAIEKQQREAVNNSTAEWMGLAMTIAVGGVMIMAIVILLTSGLMPWSD